MTDATRQALHLIACGWRQTASGKWRHDRLNALAIDGRAILVAQTQAASFQEDWDTHDKIAAEAQTNLGRGRPGTDNSLGHGVQGDPATAPSLADETPQGTRA